MSEATDAAPRPGGLWSRRMLGLPVWGWAAGGGVLLGGVWWLRRRRASTAAAAPTTGADTSGGSDQQQQLDDLYAQLAAMQDGQAAGGFGGSGGGSSGGSTGGDTGGSSSGGSSGGSTGGGSSGGGSGGSSGGSSGGGGSGGTPPPAPCPPQQYQAPGGLSAKALSPTQIAVTWAPVTQPCTPLAYSMAIYQQNGKTVTSGTVACIGSSRCSTSVSGLHPGWTYQVHVWANGGKSAPPHASTTVTMPGK